jgi:transcription antitermination factor NusG
MADQENEKLWHVIYTKSKWEKKVDSLLLQRGFESWCPVQKKERQWSDRKKIIEEPLFRSYVFVKAAKEEVAEPVATETKAAEEKPAKTADKKAQPARKPAAKAKPVDLAASGLQLVETKTETKASVVVEAETPKKPRKAAAWQKKADEAAKDEALVIVQTQK